MKVSCYKIMKRLVCADRFVFNISLGSIIIPTLVRPNDKCKKKRIKRHHLKLHWSTVSTIC